MIFRQIVIDSSQICSFPNSAGGLGYTVNFGKHVFMGFFSRLGEMVDGGLAKLEKAENTVLDKAENKQADNLLRDVAQAKQRKPVFASGLLAKLERAENGILDKAETWQANSLRHDVAEAKRIHGGETVHNVSRPVATPHVSGAEKLRQV